MRGVICMDSLHELSLVIDQFAEERDWTQFHSPANLTKSISIEAGELLECFQWDENNYSMQNVKEELADVIIYCIRLAGILNLDVKNIVLGKIEKNRIKYPIDKAKGTCTKYNNL